jgi:hypothetical protein
MNKNAVLPSQPSNEPMNALESAAADLRKRLSAPGRTVAVREPSDANEFMATLPQGRRPALKSRAGGK